MEPYLCHLYNEAEVQLISPEAWLVLNYECVPCKDDLTASGHRLRGAALEPMQTAVTTVRVREGQTTMTDGPFAGTRELPMTSP